MPRESDAVDDGAARAGAGSAAAPEGVDDEPTSTATTDRALPAAVAESANDEQAGSATTDPALPVTAAAARGDTSGDASAGAGMDDDREPSADPSIDPDGMDDGPLARGASVGFAVFPTALGECGIAWGPRGITGVHLPQESGDAVRATLASEHEGAFEAVPPREVQDVIDRIVALLAGRTQDDLADVPLDLSGLSGFLQRTYALTRAITPGHTMTYGQLAERLGSPGLARAVGRAMGANPCPIIVPCHRVLGADGSIGGFSAHGGARTKRRMLLAEGVPEQDGPALFGPDELFG